VGLAGFDPDMPLNVEHEDEELSGSEGLRFAAETLHRSCDRSRGHVRTNHDADSVHL